MVGPSVEGIWKALSGNAALLHRHGWRWPAVHPMPAAGEMEVALAESGSGGDNFFYSPL